MKRALRLCLPPKSFTSVVTTRTPFPIRELLCRLDALRHPIRLSRIHLLAGLLDLLQYSRIIHRVRGNDVRGLAIERDVERLDAYSDHISRLQTGSMCEVYSILPSSFFSTLSTAPEQPPQVMVTLNL